MNLFQRVLSVLAVCLTLLSCHVTSQVPNKTRKIIGFNAGSHFRNEIRGENGVIRGEYGYRTPDGCLHVVRYEANDASDSYRVLGTSKRDCGGGARKFSKPPNQPITKSPPTIRTTTTTTSPPPTTSSTTTTPRTTTPTTTTTQAPTTTRRVTTKRPVPQKSSGKQLAEPVGPPPDMKRPRILSPDDPEPLYSFGYEAPGHGHVQAGLPDGTKKGEFFFDSPDGWRRFVTYEANENGFFPRLRNERIPDWENSPLNPKNHFRDVKRKAKKEETGPEGPGGQREGKTLNPISPPSNGCPYYFYTNTKINFHWERCLGNGTRVGAYGKLADDGYEHRVTYFADGRGYHPRVTKTLLTREQEGAVADFTEGAFIIPNIEEQKQETERRIEEWIAQNQDRINVPL